MSTDPPEVDSELSGMGEQTRRMGRPPRISQAQIADAAVEIGLADLTLRAVADHLGVTIAALYHYIDGKDDLMRLAADRSATRLALPVDTGQHWSVWLLEWAVYNRAAFMADPVLLEQFLDGAISPTVIARGTETMLAGLVRQGFTATEALGAFELVSACAIGMAVTAIRDSRSEERGVLSPYDEVHRVATDAPTELPIMSALATEIRADRESRARAGMTTVVLGLAHIRGEDTRLVGELLDRAAHHRTPDPPTPRT
jgi:AcrR family transcriptional regulator